MSQRETLTAYGTVADKQLLDQLSETMGLSRSQVIVKLIRDKHSKLFDDNQKEPST